MESKIQIDFVIDIPEENDCIGNNMNSYLDCCDFCVEFTEKEIEEIRQFVAASKHDSNTNLMPILEDKAPELYHRLDDKAREALKLFWWHNAMSEDTVSYDEDILKKNYYRDIETGDFVPSDDFEPEGDYDEDEDLEYIEWYERELDRMTYEDAQWFRERYNEDFEGVDVGDDIYFCHIPSEFLSKT